MHRSGRAGDGLLLLLFLLLLLLLLRLEGSSKQKASESCTALAEKCRHAREKEGIEGLGEESVLGGEHAKR